MTPEGVIVTVPSRSGDQLERGEEADQVTEAVNRRGPSPAHRHAQQHQRKKRDDPRIATVSVLMPVYSVALILDRASGPD